MLELTKSKNLNIDSKLQQLGEIEYALRGPLVFSPGIVSYDANKHFDEGTQFSEMATPIFPPRVKPSQTISRLLKVVESPDFTHSVCLMKGYNILPYDFVDR